MFKMKKYTRTLILAAIAAALMIGTPYIKTTCDSGLALPFAVTGAILGCGGEKEPLQQPDGNEKSMASAAENKTELKVTLVELGSVNCVPCRMMKPVIEKVESRYRNQVKVIFHDVWTEEGKSAGYKFAVRVIPTQVFLDSTGKEYFRHEGFFSFEEIEKVLKQKGVK